MINEVLNESEEKMKKTVEVLRKDLASVRAGRANPAMLDKITVDYYGTPTPVNQLANVSVPEPRMLIIQPWINHRLRILKKLFLNPIWSEPFE
jgi:ribosome recycling factor